MASFAVLLLLLSYFGSTDTLAQDYSQPESQTPAAQLGNWTLYTAATNIHDIAFDATRNEVWVATGGGAFRWDLATGTYVKYTSIDGLPANLVSAVALDAEGNRWFGTASTSIAVLWADGQWQSFTFNEWALGADNWITDIAVSPSGDIWFSLYHGGVIRYRDQRWDLLTTDDGLAANNAQAVVVDADGTVWIGHEWSGVSYLRQDGRWGYLTSATGLPSDQVTAMAVDVRGQVWFGTDKGVAVRSRDEQWRYFTTELFWNVHTIAVAPGGRAYIATWQNLVVLYPDYTFLTYFDFQPRALLATDDNTLWASKQDGTLYGPRGLGVFEGSESEWRRLVAPWRQFANPDTVAEYDYISAIVAQNGDKWFGTGSRAVVRLTEDGEWTAYDDVPELVAGRWILAIAEDSQGGLWFGTERGGVVHRSAMGTWSAFLADSNGDDFGPVWDLAIADDDSIWLVTGTRLVSIHVGGAMTTHTVAMSTGRSVAVDRRGQKWVGTRSGVAILDPSGRWRNVTVADGLAHDTVADVSAARDGGMWIVTDNRPDLGLAPGPRLEIALNHIDEDGRVTVVRPNLQVESYEAHASRVVEDRTGGVWIATYGQGVLRWSVDRAWTQYRAADRLGSDILWDVAVDESSGDVWFPLVVGGIARYSMMGENSCISPVWLTSGVESSAAIADEAGLVFAFDVPSPFSRVEVVVPDRDDRLSLTAFRACELNAGTGTGRHIGPGTGRHIGPDQRLVIDVTSQTGKYYLHVAPKAGVHGFPLPIRVKLSVTAIDTRQIRTLLLTHTPAIQAEFGLNAADPEFVAWRTAIEQLAAHPAVTGQVVWNLESETDGAVAAAYQLWLDNQRDITLSNGLASALSRWIWSVRDALTSVQYVVILGDDRVVPHFRLAVLPSHERADGWVNEDSYIEDGSIDAGSPIGSALLRNRTLTDDIYAAQRPTFWGDGQQLFVPEIAVGRLVESPATMTTVIGAFLSNDGETVLEQSLVAGYDFMQDATDLAHELFGQAGLPPERRSRLGGLDWSADSLRDALLGPRNDVVFLAAHANHYTYNVPGNTHVEAGELASGGDLAGLVAYTLACHGGLNVPGTTHRQSVDLPEAWLARGATYIGTTGWAYGMPHLLAYQERLMVDFTTHLVNGDGGAVGNSLVEAKRRYVRDHSLTALHVKTVAGTVLYGLPMHRLRLGSESRVGAATVEEFRGRAASGEPIAEFEQADGGAYVTTTRYPLAGSGVERVDTPDGSYYTLSGMRPFADAGQSVQPQLQVDLGEISRDRLSMTPRGAIIVGAQYRDERNFRPLIQAAQTFSLRGAHSFQPVLPTDGWMPAVPVLVQRLGRTPGTGTLLIAQEEATLLLNAGQYHGGRGIQRLFEEMVLDHYYSASGDKTGPTITAVEIERDTEGHRASVGAMDSSGVARVVVAYDAGDGTWANVELSAAGGGRWTGTFPGDDTWLVQAVDRAGNATSVSDGAPFVPGCPECPLTNALYLPRLVTKAR